MADLRVVVVAEEALARAGLAALLREQANLDVVGQVSDLGPDDVHLYSPDLIIFDLGWEADASLAALAELAEADVPVLALAPDEEHAPMAWRAGARGILSREARPEMIEAAVEGLASGLAVVDLAMAQSTAPLGPPPPASPVEPLTPRELEVLQRLAEGLSNRAIAVRLGISEHTVKFHVNALMGKLGAQSRTEAVVRATRLGLIVL